MSWMFPRPRLHANEILQAQLYANHVQNGRAVGGRLYITSQRLVFEPSRMEQLLRGKSWEMQRSDLVETGTRGRGWDILAGGLRRSRLVIDRRSGPSEVFVVSHADQMEELLGRWT